MTAAIQAAFLVVDGWYPGRADDRERGCLVVIGGCDGGVGGWVLALLATSLLGWRVTAGSTVR